MEYNLGSLHKNEDGRVFLSRVYTQCERQASIKRNSMESFLMSSNNFNIEKNPNQNPDIFPILGTIRIFLR